MFEKFFNEQYQGYITDPEYWRFCFNKKADEKTNFYLDEFGKIWEKYFKGHHILGMEDSIIISLLELCDESLIGVFPISYLVDAHINPYPDMWAKALGNLQNKNAVMFFTKDNINFRFKLSSSLLDDFITNFRELGVAINKSPSHEPGYKKIHKYKFTYFLVDTQSKDIKIGKTSNIKNRMKGYSTENLHISLLFYVNGDYEEDFHKYFHEYRIQGEWFKGIPKKDLLMGLRSICPDSIDYDLVENQFDKYFGRK